MLDTLDRLHPARRRAVAEGGRAGLVAPLLALAALAGIALSTVDMAQAAEEGKLQRTISVSAEGSVLARPDMARISSGVVSEAKTAREALTANTAAMQKLIAALKEAGIAPADLQTSSINVQPRYTHYKDGQAPRIDGYSVNNDLAVVVRDLKKLGEILDQIVTLGANQIGGLSFDVSNGETLRDEARKAAVANARKRATLYAEAAGVQLGDVVTITEGAVHEAPRGPMLARAASMKSVPVEEGSQKIEVEVSITWALR
jgi:uncharacterized protein YggE